MWQSVEDSFLGFSTPLEGRVLWMYADSLGLVSIGVGNLIDPIGLAKALPGLGAPYYDKANQAAPVSDAQIEADWNAIKTSRAGWQAAEDQTQLRITDEGCDALVRNKAAEFETYLTSHAIDPATGASAFGDFANWPADAQLALLSMAWAMGPAFADGGKWPSFRAACVAADWRAAAANCKMSNDWLIRRNAVNRGMFRNAWWASVQDPPVDPSALWLPIDVPRPDITPGTADPGDGSTTYVAEAQRFLTFLGYPTDESGVYDDAMLVLVKQFQTDEGFPTTGTIGPLTWAALGYLVPTN